MERIVTQYNSARGVIRFIVPQQETIGPNGPIIARGLPFIRGVWRSPTALLRVWPNALPGEYDAADFFGDDLLRGRVNVVEVTNFSGKGMDSTCVARFVSKGPITPGKTCPAALRRLIEEVTPQHV